MQARCHIRKPQLVPVVFLACGLDTYKYLIKVLTGPKILITIT